MTSLSLPSLAECLSCPLISDLSEPLYHAGPLTLLDAKRAIPGCFGLLCGDGFVLLKPKPATSALALASKTPLCDLSVRDLLTDAQAEPNALNAFEVSGRIELSAGVTAEKMPASAAVPASTTAKNTFVSAALTISCFTSMPLAKVGGRGLLSAGPAVGKPAMDRKKKPVVVELCVR